MQAVGERQTVVEEAELKEIGLWVVGQVMLPPRFYPGGVDDRTGDRRPDQYAVTVFYGAPENATFYVDAEKGHAIQAGDVIRIGPCRAGRNGRLYLVER